MLADSPERILALYPTKIDWTCNVDVEADTSMLRSSKSTKVDVTLLVQSAQQQSLATSV
jgi:hypothetical protein